MPRERLQWRTALSHGYRLPGPTGANWSADLVGDQGGTAPFRQPLVPTPGTLLLLPTATPWRRLTEAVAGARVQRVLDNGSSDDASVYAGENGGEE